jgi:hypothetical protein
MVGVGKPDEGLAEEGKSIDVSEEEEELLFE